MVYVIVTAGIIIFSSWSHYLQAPQYPHQRVIDAQPLLHGFLPFDSEHYYTIAAEGYTTHSYSQAFFPLYPLAVRAVSTIMPIDAAMLVVSWTCTFGAAIFVYLWAAAELRTHPLTVGKLPQTLLLLLAVYPFSFFCIMGYPESLFIMMTAASLYSYRTNHLFMAGLLGALSSLTRFHGIFLAVFFITDYLFRRRWNDWRRLMPALMTPIGLLAFMLYQWHTFGNPLAFIDIQRLWYRFSGTIVSGIVETLTPISVGVVLLAAALIILTYHTLSKPLAFYVACSFFVPVLSGSLDSLNRYALSAFPIFLAFAMLFVRMKRSLQIGIIATSIILLVASIAFISNLYFIG